MPPPNYAQAVNTVSGQNFHDVQHQQAATNFNQGNHNMHHWNSAQQHFSSGFGPYPSPAVVTYANRPMYQGYSRINKKLVVIISVVFVIMFTAFIVFIITRYFETRYNNF